MSSKEEIKALTTSILESRANSKKIPDLIKALDDPTLTKISLNALVKVFNGLAQKGDLHIEEKSNEAVQKYSEWLTNVLDETFSKIASKVASNDDKTIKELCLSTFMKLFVASHDPKSEDSWTSTDSKRFKILMEAMLSSEYDNQVVIQRFQEHLEYCDVKFHSIQYLARLTKKPKGLIFRSNLLKILEVFNVKDEEEESDGLLIKSKLNNETFQKNFNQVWQDFAKLQHKEVEIYKRILILLTDKVLPVLKNPLHFTDFLLESYNVGGSISLLALNGVFFLITKHNLEYPDFYTKLYKLCTPELLHAKYRARFFYLANLFLASSHLPEYIVAAFIKRLSRLCLTAPANAILLILPFVGNLLIRHKSLLRMIDNEEEHYLMEETDPKNSKAAESGLWEIKTLQSHALPQVAQAAKFINKSVPQMEWNVEEYLEITPEEMFATEAKKKIFVNVPLTFERPKGLAFAKDDMTSQLFA